MDRYLLQVWSRRLPDKAGKDRIYGHSQEGFGCGLMGKNHTSLQISKIISLGLLGVHDFPAWLFNLSVRGFLPCHFVFLRIWVGLGSFVVSI